MDVLVSIFPVRLVWSECRYILIFISVSLYLGQRRSNILALRWGDIDFENDIV